MTELNEQRNTYRDQELDGKLHATAMSRELGLLTERIARLGEAEEELCPVCKKPLTARERQLMVADLQADKSTMEVQLREQTRSTAALPFTLEDGR